MALVRWTEELSVHHPEMDAQHRHLFALAEALWASADEPGSNADKLIEGVVEYTNTHFANEEALLTSIGYPDVKRHRHLHKSIFDAVDGIVARLDGADPKILVREVAEFVNEWLVRHIRNEDLRYGRFIAEGRGAGRGARDDGADPLVRMRRLKVALDEGLISAEDYERRKREMLGEF